MAVKFPGVKVKLIGEDSNVFFIGARVSKALRRAGHGDQVAAFQDELTNSQSYDEALQVVMHWVETS